MKSKTLFVGLLLALPMFGFAANSTSTSAKSATSTVATTTRSILEVANKDAKKEEIRKQLNDTIDMLSALVRKIQNLEKRALERGDILASQDNFSQEVQDKIDVKQKKLEALLTSIDERIDNNLKEVAETLLASSKPARSVSAFRKEVNKIKADIISAHKMVIEIIDLVKKESLKAEKDIATTTPDQIDSSND